MTLLIAFISSFVASYAYAEYNEYKQLSDRTKFSLAAVAMFFVGALL